MAEKNSLKQVLEHLGITNNELAGGTNIDPSLISRYLSGQRQLKASSWQADSIAEYIMQAADSAEKIDWLNNQFREAGMQVDMSSIFHMKDNLISWISSDGGRTVREISYDGFDNEKAASGENADSYGTLSVGFNSIMNSFDSVIYDLPDQAILDVFLSSDRCRMLAEPGFVQFLQNAVARKQLKLNVVICVSGSTQALHKLINCYMKNIVDGSIQFYTFFGSAQNLAEQMYVVVNGRAAIIVTETTMGASEPIALFIKDEVFVREISQSFNATYRYSQPMFNIYDDGYTRNMIEILYTEYCLPGGLCVIKDSINPMYMSFENYCRVLRKSNSDDGEYAWKCNEYRRFKEGFTNMIENGMVCTEIISYKRLKTIVKEGMCKMAGLYFLTTGFFELDLQGCMDILTGYVDYLEKYPNFSLLILDDLPQLHGSNCWHVKNNSSIAVNDWNGSTPIMLHSNQNVVIQEFQKHFDSIWELGKGSDRNRAYIISVLRSVIEELKKRLSSD